MSKHQSSLAFKENSLPKGIPPTTLEDSADMDEVFAAQRVTLQTLQPSAKTKGLVGSHGQIIHHGKDLKSKQKTQSIQGKIQVFEDKTSNTGPKKNMVEDRGVQTDPIELEESKSKTAENDIDVEYYSTMAERRRVALSEALEENEHLHLEVDSLKTEINALKAENSVLKPLAEEAEYLAGVIKGLLGSEEEEETTEGATASTSDS
ncbi:geminin-like [Daphnia pulicaria]|uniref:geminin-like n=1 Tax=Daphnia pulicaria TaxID=35523 RepID=UPI001EEA4F75|nr:geminin-like [Daphnia pulicaria]